ncbi:hypothetical protein TNCV_4760121 [Trichonephila clavipes]|uniref:Uncharacterized protein n=1 Tax=Trichonephila clavipes TaxID=2585209 RepID=A0A8X6UZ26_TRICX|nr:hypothetical protein TNCV_4760121 [Trichonephila clavipes]
MNTVAITAELNLYSSLKRPGSILLQSSISKWRRRKVGVKSSSRNRHRNPKFSLARRNCMVREDTMALSEGATCAWMAIDEAVGCNQTLLMTWAVFSTTGLSRAS